MSNVIDFRQNALMGHAIVTPTGGGVAQPFHVFCNLPGGKPWGSFDPLNTRGTRMVISNAPQCMTMREFREFINAPHFSDQAFAWF